MRGYSGPVLVLVSALVIMLAVFALMGRGAPAAPSGAPGVAHESMRPLFHACLNGTCALLLVAGFRCVRRRRFRAHVACMLLATSVSLVFLGSYLEYHYRAGSTPFQGEGWSRPLYFAVLLSHTLLAALVVPLAAALLGFAATRRFERHRRVARWAFPIWVYVSLTGVLIYLMLYVWFAPGTAGAGGG
jgi:uncharacterized membrane protein YozB (DUF420 family)